MPEITGVHPAAELFPMLPEPELVALAEDIRENGQRVPAVLDQAGRLLDGRNRVAACKIAGVDPAFVTVEVSQEDGDGLPDPVEYVVSLNVKRRNLTVGQKAIAAAEAWPMYEVGQGKRTDLTFPRNGEGAQTAERLAAMFGIGKTSIENARALLGCPPDLDLADEVRAATRTLADAYKTHKEREKGRTAEADKLNIIRERRPDLAELVEGGSLKVADAYAPIETDEREAKEGRERIRQTIGRAILGVNFDHGLTLVHTIEALREDPENFTPEMFDQVAQTASVIADAIDRKHHRGED